MMPVKFALIIALLNLLPMVVVGLLAAGLAGALTGRAADTEEIGTAAHDR